MDLPQAIRASLFAIKVLDKCMCMDKHEDQDVLLDPGLNINVLQDLVEG